MPEAASLPGSAQLIRRPAACATTATGAAAACSAWNAYQSRRWIQIHCCRRAADPADPAAKLNLVEGKVLGGGAFSRVSKVVEETQQRAYAMKRMRKATVLQCPDHVFCEQLITRNTAHPFCIRQVRTSR